MNECYVDHRCYEESPLVERVTIEEMVESGKVFSRSFLSNYLRERVRNIGRNYRKFMDEYKFDFERLGPVLTEQIMSLARVPFSGELHIIGNWQSELGLNETGCLEPDLVPSHKISHYQGAASRFSGEETVLLTGKLAGTEQHFKTVRYLALHAGVILGLEPRRYYQESAKKDERFRAEPYLKLNLLASLYTHHPLVSGVVFVPEAAHSSDEAANLFYEAFFSQVGATWACATANDPDFARKLGRGKKPESDEDDWRVIPLFEGAQTSSRLARLNLFDNAILNARIEALTKLKNALDLLDFANKE